MSNAPQGSDARAQDAAGLVDPVMVAINAAIARGRNGRRKDAVDDLESLWEGIGVTGNPLHRCWLAHSIADLCEDPADSFLWDVRALDGAKALEEGGVGDVMGVPLAGFWPSLHLNLADDCRCLGAAGAAARHLSQARSMAGSLPNDDYGALLRGLIDRVGTLIAAGERGPLDREGNAR